MEQVILDSNALEATVKIRLHPSEPGTSFLCSPHWIDGLAHLAGFVLNGSDSIPDDLVFISRGWRSSCIAGKLDPSRTYQNYVRMQRTGPGDILAGDVCVFGGESIVAFFEGVEFRGLKRSMAAALLPKNSTSSVA